MKTTNYDMQELMEYLREETSESSYNKRIRYDLGNNGYRLRKAPTMDGNYEDLVDSLMEGND